MKLPGSRKTSWKYEGAIWEREEDEQVFGAKNIMGMGIWKYIMSLYENVTLKPILCHWCVPLKTLKKNCKEWKMKEGSLLHKYQQ